MYTRRAADSAVTVTAALTCQRSRMSNLRLLRNVNGLGYFLAQMQLRSSGPRPLTTNSSGAVLPLPHRTRFGILGIIGTVIPGLLIGATISKKMANFLEENELFVPADDDDDDD